jgi:hypothetical protein
MVKTAKSRSEIIREYIAANPGKSVTAIAEATKCSYGLVYDVLKRMNNKTAPAKRGRKPKALPVLGSGDAYEQKNNTWQAVVTTTPQVDNVNHPSHYKVGGVETIDFIEAKKLTYNLGNVVKYVTRAEHKGNTYEDLCKARWYLNREISKYTGVANQ